MRFTPRTRPRLPVRSLLSGRGRPAAEGASWPGMGKTLAFTSGPVGRLDVSWACCRLAGGVGGREGTEDGWMQLNELLV